MLNWSDFLLQKLHSYREALNLEGPCCSAPPSISAAYVLMQSVCAWLLTTQTTWKLSYQCVNWKTMFDTVNACSTCALISVIIWDSFKDFFVISAFLNFDDDYGSSTCIGENISLLLVRRFIKLLQHTFWHRCIFHFKWVTIAFVV